MRLGAGVFDWPRWLRAEIAPDPAPDPQLIRFNRMLAQELGLEPDALPDTAKVAYFSGARLFDGSQPVAACYAGHQFGNFVPRLGDGRAHHLGTRPDRAGLIHEIQLKGSGRTPFSRSGDGRAWLGPVLREYIVSETMHGLGIPTTRALAAVLSGAKVQRETALPGAILTRTARSFIRVGSLQYAAASGGIDGLRFLIGEITERCYPDLVDAPVIEVLRAIIAAQADLVARWMAVGFIHGVMNTDNMALSGETIDYGPCAFLDAYDPRKVFSSIDHQGRYAYGNQPQVAQWNLAQLASAMLPLMPGDDGLHAAQAAVDGFMPLFEAAWVRQMGRKLGLADPTEADRPMIEAFLAGLAQHQLDFHTSFARLPDLPAPLADWGSAWKTRRAAQDTPFEEVLAAANPAFIPRNHRIEAAIAAAMNADFAPFHQLADAAQNPWNPDHAPLAAPPAPGEEVRATFCGT